MLLVPKPDTTSLNILQISLNKISNVYIWNYVMRTMNELFNIKHPVLDLGNKINTTRLQFRCVMYWKQKYLEDLYNSSCKIYFCDVLKCETLFHKPREVVICNLNILDPNF